MSLMSFLETMGTSSFPLVAAFFIGLMTAISPCPLGTNIAAIAYVSRKISSRNATLTAGFTYTLGRMLTYIVLASSIVYIGLNVQPVSLFLQRYGEKILGPVLVTAGLILLNVIKLDLKIDGRFEGVTEKLSKKGHPGSFFLGVIFALAFCPFSAVLFFGMLIPLALKFSDGVLIPAVFAFATGLPVIVFSFVLVSSVSKLGEIMNRVQLFERGMRYTVAIALILTGLYYTITLWIKW